jgi:hypothetical protein
MSFFEVRSEDEAERACRALHTGSGDPSAIVDLRCFPAGDGRWRCEFHKSDGTDGEMWLFVGRAAGSGG